MQFMDIRFGALLLAFVCVGCNLIFILSLAALMEALKGMGKVEKMLNIWHAGMLFYTLATWSLALAG